MKAFFLKKNPCFLLLLWLSSCYVLHAQKPFNCFAISDEGNPNVFFIYDSATNSWTEIGSTGVNGIESLAYNPFDSILYTVDSDELGTIDLSTGDFTSISGQNIGTLSGANGDYTITDIDGLTFDPYSRILWASERRGNGSDLDYLLQIDPQTGLFIPDAFGLGVDYAVVPAVYDSITAQNVHDVDDIAIDPYNGDLYAIQNQGGDGGMLTILNKADGTIKQVINDFNGIDDMESLGFYNNGTFYSSTGNNGPAEDVNRFFLINKLTGQLTEQAQIDGTNTQKDFEACDCLTGEPNKIIGIVFEDINKNGQWDVGEPFVPNVTVNLYRDSSSDGLYTATQDPLVFTEQTDVNGLYEFEIAATGGFVVSVDTTTLPPGEVVTTATLLSIIFNDVGLESLENNFGICPPACSIQLDKVQMGSCNDNGDNTFSSGVELHLSWANEPTGLIAILLDGNTIGTVDAENNLPPYIHGFSIPANGTTSHELILRFQNDLNCADTTWLNYPNPCPTPLPNPCTGTNGIGGQAFGDYNYNGADDNNGAGTAGIAVHLYDCNNTLVEVTYTDANGNYQFNTAVNDGDQYRVEFVLPETLAYLSPTHAGTDNGTTVQFVTVSGGGACVAVGLSNPNAYCQDNPYITLPCYEGGTGENNNNTGIASFTYNASGLPAAYTGGSGNPNGTAENPRTDATIAEVGGVWGIAYQKSQQRLFASTFLKRHVGLVDGPGYIYTVDYSSGTGNVTGSFDLQGVIPTNGGAAINVGTVCRDATCALVPGRTGIASDYTLPADPTNASIDLDAFGKVGTISFGDADMDEDGNYLWVVNLYQKALIRIEVQGNTASLPGVVTQYLLTDIMGLPVCNNGVLRPWALEFHNGKGYLGAVCDASIAQNRNDLMAYVLSFDPNNIQAGFLEELRFPLNYNRENIQSGPTLTNIGWQAWGFTWDEVDPITNGTDNNYLAPQPILSDIEITENGDMVLGFIDRFGNQNGRANHKAISQNNDFVDTNSGGDLVHACSVNGNFEIEGSPSCPTNDTNLVGDPTNTLLTDDGPSNNGEYYFEDHFTSDTGNIKFAHSETATGSLALLPGTNEVVTTHYDPLWGPPRIVNSQGVVWHNTTTGQRTDAYQVVESSTVSPQTFAKSNGLGDLELLCKEAPIEIGNYVWFDSNQNGIQDACESPIPGIAMTLYGANGDSLATVVTDVNGQYYFNETTLVDTTLLPHTDYYIIVGEDQFSNGEIGDSLLLTNGNVTMGNNADEIDSDPNPNDLSDGLGGGNIPDQLPYIFVQTAGVGENDHSYDVGFITMSCPPQPCIPIRIEKKAAP